MKTFSKGTWICRGDNIYITRDTEIWPDEWYELKNAPDLTPKTQTLADVDPVVGIRVRYEDTRLFYRVVAVAAGTVCLQNDLTGILYLVNHRCYKYYKVLPET